MATYDELRLRIDRGVSRGSYRILATGPAGEALGRFKLPFSEMELENFILKLGAPRRGRRRIDSPEMELAKSFGTKLFDAVFEGDVRELFRSSYADSRNNGRGLRVSLSLTGVPELLEVPWEYLYDHPTFLSISTWTPVVRYLDLPKPRRPLGIELPLRILGMISAPSDAEPIDVQQERQKLETALAPLKDAGAIEIDWLEEASLRALQRQLRKADYHVFHFIGHGGYDDAADDGVLLFQDEQGRGRQISGIQLGTMLADEVSLRLAILNACEGGRSSLQDPFSGVATSLIEREIPAVIGMQFEITDRAAIVFASEFYSALADGLPVDSSVAEARKAIYADRNDIEWGTPVLFMRVADGRLFDVAQHAPVRAAVPVDSPIETAVTAPEPREEPPEFLEGLPAAIGAKPEPTVPEHVLEPDARPREPELPAPQLAVKPFRPEVAVSTSALAPDAAQQVQAPPVEPLAAASRSRPAWRSPTIPDGLWRAAWRAALGAVLATVIFGVWYLVREIEKASERLPQVISAAPGLIGATVLVAIAIVTIAEYLVPFVRVPGGALYRPVAGNRLAAAAIQGAIVGATAWYGVIWWRFHEDDPTVAAEGTAVDLAVIGAVGFAIAEAVITWAARRRANAAAET